jgi:hypothetical protein
MGTQCPPGAEGSGGVTQLPHLAGRKERRERSAPLAGESLPGDESRPRGLGPRVACKHTDGGETIFPLGRRRGQSGPVERGLPTPMALRPLRGVVSKIMHQSFLSLERATCGSA